MDVDLSPAPASSKCEASVPGYMGHNRSRTGRKLARVSAWGYQEMLWQEVLPGNTLEALAVLKQAIGAMEALLGIAEECPEAARKCQYLELRVDVVGAVTSG